MRPARQVMKSRCRLCVILVTLHTIIQWLGERLESEEKKLLNLSKIQSNTHDEKLSIIQFAIVEVYLHCRDSDSAVIVRCLKLDRGMRIQCVGAGAHTQTVLISW